MVLVDSSARIEVLRSEGTGDLREHVRLEQVVTCPPVIQEVLQGIRVESVYRTAREALMNFPICDSPMPLSRWTSAGQIYRLARRRGFTLRRGSLDSLIAACALRYDLVVLHRDRDFERLAEVVPLRTIPFGL